MKRIDLIWLLTVLLILPSQLFSQEKSQTSYKKIKPVKMGDYLFYTSNDSLFKVDQKFKSPQLIKNGLEKPDQFTVVGNKIFFANNKIKNGSDSVWTELWICNGEKYNTYKIKSFNGLSILAPYNGTIFFAADDNKHGIELWTSNGITEETYLVKDINEGKEGSLTYSIDTNSPVLYLNQLFFAASDNTHGRELWKSNGQENGTELIKDLEPGVNSSAPRMLTVSGEYLYFAIKNEYSVEPSYTILLKTNGNPFGTEVVKDFDGAKYSKISRLVNVNGTLHFTLESTEPDNDSKNELWRTNGTSWTTEMLLELER